MSAEKYPIDINLWKLRRQASKSESWKWSRELWDPVIHEILQGGRDTASELACPVCGKQKLYAFFVTAEVSKQSRGKEDLIFIGDRWFGCSACRTQFRDRGELPEWLKLTDMVWETPEVKNEVLEEIRRLERH